MTNLAYEAVKRLTSHPREEYLEAFRRGESLLRDFGLTTPLRLAHFLAQVIHESGGLYALRENLNYKADQLLKIFGEGKHSANMTVKEATFLAGQPEAIAERIYGQGNPKKAAELGNTQPGDGYRYRGNGLLQITGRGMHREIGQAFGLDLEGAPELVTVSDHALKPPLHFWQIKGLNAWADKNDLEKVTKGINGGKIGLEERQAWFDKLLPWLESQSPSVPIPEEKAKWLQASLNALGANPKLAVDGHCGPRTVEALKVFQTGAGLSVDGRLGLETEMALRRKLQPAEAMQAAAPTR